MSRNSEGPASVLKKLLNDQLYTGNSGEGRYYKGKTITDKARYHNPGQLNIEKYIKENFNNPIQTEVKITEPGEDTVRTEGFKADASAEMDISIDKLKEAVVWTEILGKPVCRRRKRYR